QTLQITGTNSMKEVVSKINEAAGGIVQASLNDSGKLILTSQNSESITVSNAQGTAALTAVGSGTNTTTGFSLVLNKQPGFDGDIEVTSDDAAVLAGAGLNAHQTDGSVKGSDVALGALNKG